MSSVIPTTFPMVTLDMVNIVLGRIIDRQVHGVLIFDGRIDERRMARAVRLLMDAEPILGCRVVMHPKRPYWARRTDLEEPIGCSLMETSEVDDEIGRFVFEEADPEHDPMVRVKIFRDAVDTVAVKISHVAADGGGTKDCLYLLAEIYRKLGENADYRPESNVRGDRSQWQVLRGAGLRSSLRMLKGFPAVSPVAAFPYRNPDRHARALTIRRFAPVVFRNLKVFAREHGATFNDVLLAAYYRVLFQLVPHDPDIPMPVNVPVDLRAYMRSKKAEAITNLGGGFYPTVIPASCVDLKSTLICVQASMRQWKAEGPRLGWFVLMDTGILRPPFEAIKRHMEPGYDQSERSGQVVHALTNIGLLDQEKLHFGELKLADAYMISPLFFPPNFVVGVSTFKEHLTLTAAYCREKSGESAVEIFMDRMVGELMAIGVGAIDSGQEY